ncbi:MAG: hypothetical protein ACTHN7_01725 [Solirubrobacterales bacterium]
MIGLVVLCALLVVCSDGSAGAIHVSSSKCRPVGSKTIALEVHGRVYSLPLRGPSAERDPEGVRVVGCLFGTGHPLLLGRTAFVSSRDPAKNPIDPDVAAISAPFAAYSTRFQGVDFNRVWVVVRNLRNGEVVDIAEASPRVGVEPVSSVTDLAVASSAAVAWISKGQSLAGGGPNSEVALSAPGQPTEILEEGDIDPTSLELHGKRLTWTSEGVQHSAEMP